MLRSTPRRAIRQPRTPQAKTSISAAVAIGTFNQNSNAYIGPGSTVAAQNIAVSANSLLPITNTWTQWAGLSEVLSHLNGTLGIVNNILTSYANAIADVEKYLARRRVQLSSASTTRPRPGSRATRICRSRPGVLGDGLDH